jgi:hypothetical protein
MMNRLSENMRREIISEIYDRIEEGRRIDSSFYYRGYIYHIIIFEDSLYIELSRDIIFIMEIDEEMKERL